MRIKKLRDLWAMGEKVLLICLVTFAQKFKCLLLCAALQASFALVIITHIGRIFITSGMLVHLA